MMQSDLVERLCRQSVLKHYDAYADIEWDAPENRIDATDPRWELIADDMLGATAWYRDQPQPTRARLGLHLIVSAMKTGAQFEGVLKAGLLEFAATRPDGSLDKRYALHELIEEIHHVLMFNEFVRRSGLPASGIPKRLRPITRRISRLGSAFPALFFIFVLGGEDPIDHVQRQVLASGRTVHPLLRRVIQIHVTEEARHLAFARDYLRRHVPALSSVKRAALAAAAPVILGPMARMMLLPSAEILATYGIPSAVIEEAYTKNPRNKQRVLDSLANIRELLVELGVVPAPARSLWRLLGLWSSTDPAHENELEHVNGPEPENQFTDPPTMTARSGGSR